jgi:Holliday junction resolvase RusA-like endonuclease
MVAHRPTKDANSTQSVLGTLFPIRGRLDVCGHGANRKDRTMTTLSFTVPGRPVPKARPRIGQGHTYTPQTTKEYEARVAYAALEAMSPESRTVPLFEVAHIAVSINVCIVGKADVDNIAKSILDGLTGVVWKDDNQVFDLHIRKRLTTRELERAEITISLLGEPTHD